MRRNKEARRCHYRSQESPILHRRLNQPLRRCITTKQFYSDHVAHAMQMYQLRPHEATTATIHDIDACAGALADMTPTDANIIIDVYRDGHFPDAVRLIAKQYHVRDNYVWSLIDDFGRKFARLRGLL